MIGCLFVCAVLGLIMGRSGASLRPIYWFAGFFALVVVPQFFGHLYNAIHTTRVEAVRNPADAKSIFGADVDPHFVTDARAAFGDVFGQAESAQLAVLPSGETVLIAKFNGYSKAEKAWVNYLSVSGLNQIKGEGDSQRGFAVTRPSGDRAYVLHMSNMVGIWTAKDDETIRKRMLAGGFEIPRRAPLAEIPASGATEEEKRSTSNRSLPIPVLVGGMAIYLLLIVLYFFKGAAWAGSSAAKAGVRPALVSEVAGQLESINSLDVPFQIERTGANELIATWRYADAKWIDLARARGLRRTFRIRLSLDEQAHTVRATDYAAGYDWSAGRGGAEVEWKALLGIVFFQYEHQRVFGLQLDEQGRFKPDVSYAYTFNLKEMKSPLIEAVTRSGWTWRPTIWQGPKWLRWLTE